MMSYFVIFGFLLLLVIWWPYGDMIIWNDKWMNRNAIFLFIWFLDSIQLDYEALIDND